MAHKLVLTLVSTIFAIQHIGVKGSGAIEDVPVPRPNHFYSCIYNFTKNGPRLPHKYCNASVPLEERLNDLLGRLSDWEKTMMLRTQGYEVPRLGLPKLGSMENTHGVKSNCGQKNVYGNNTGCATSFPSGPGMGAAFDKKLWHDVGTAIGTEVRGLHNQMSNPSLSDVPGLHYVDIALYSLDPNINLMRDPRWGRAQEVPGEDPYLTGEFAVHLVQGMQYGRSDDKGTMLSAVTVKHFSLYDFEGYIPRIDEGPLPSGYCDTPKQGCQRWNSDSVPPLADFVDYFLEPFQKVITQAQPASIMCSYNAVYGKPTCADDAINNKLARGTWGFEGFFVSDCSALELMQNVGWNNCVPPYPSDGGRCVPQNSPFGHNYTHTVDETVHAALVEGGIDVNCGFLYVTNLYSSYLNGAVTSDDINKAARRVFRLMIKLGMLDPQEDQPFVNDFGPNDVDSSHHRNLALEAARKSLVLLKNDHKVLPLKAKSSVAFIGPHANSSQALLSNYFGENALVNDWTPFISALKSQHFSNVSYALGAQICDYDYGKNPGFPNQPCNKAAGGNATLLKEAVRLAKNVDTVILLLGSDQTTEAENYDRKSLALAGNGSQAALIDAVANVNPNVVVVLIHGGPVTFDHSNVPAILDAFYPGELGGKAIVDALIGDYNPGGKLPYTKYFANFTTGRDIRDTDLSSGTGITHMYFSGPVMFPFGHGLSYTDFTYHWADVDSVVVKDDNYIFNITVENVGQVAGDAVCLAFLRDPSYAISNRQLRLPKAKLVGFERVYLKAGESRSVQMSLNLSKVAFMDEKTAERVLPAGTTWTVEIGDIRTPVKKRILFHNENSGDDVLEQNEIVRERYLTWKKEHHGDLITKS